MLEPLLNASNPSALVNAAGGWDHGTKGVALKNRFSPFAFLAFRLAHVGRSARLTHSIPCPSALDDRDDRRKAQADPNFLDRPAS